LDDLEASLFADIPADDDTNAPSPSADREFATTFALQGQAGVQLAAQAVADGRPFELAFIDMRMPPGWDGLETTLELWKISPDTQVVICTAYSDYHWDDLIARIGGSDQLVILKKPFDPIEVLQLANALTEKHRLARAARLRLADLEALVQSRTADLQATNIRLREEIAERIHTENELARARDRAIDADRAKSAFLANMSHEIRTPMNGVIGMASLLLDSKLDPDQRDFVQTIAQSGEALLRIINDILDFSKIEAGRLTLETIDFNLAELVETTFDLAADLARAKNLELIWDIAPDVVRTRVGDPVRLRQVILNLVGNAIKFTSAGEVSLLITNATPGDAATPDTALRFAVTDTGIGIPAEALPTLFKPFTQADASTTRKFGGTGLGLAICKRIVELMQGSIQAASQPGRGSTSTFTADLPPAAHVTPPAPAVSPLLDGRHALIVDDNATNRKLLTRLFANWGLTTHAVDGARAALEALRRPDPRPYDIAVLDYQMPDMDGLALASAIRDDRDIPPVKLMLLTSMGERLTDTQLALHGLDACQLKPIHPTQLQNGLRDLLGQTPAPRRATAPTAPAETPDNTAVASILVVEDNPVNQKVALRLLKKLGHHADLAGNGHEALDALRKTPYSIVFMDAQMPGMDGATATRHIRQAQADGDPAFPATLRIIAMTANAMSGDRDACLAAGMDDYISKPYRTDDLQRVLSRNLAALDPGKHHAAVA